MITSSDTADGEAGRADVAEGHDPDGLDRLDGVEAAARRLLRDLDARPLSARSLVLSFLLGTHPPAMSAARLVAFGELFGLRAGTVRTALSRMVASGDATVDDGRYRLAGRLLDRQARQDLSQAPAATAWDGAWWTAIVVGEDRSVTDRRHFRAAMEDARLGELRPDLWMRPANVAAPAARDDVVVTRGPFVSGDPADLARRLWDLPATENVSRELLAVLEALGHELDDAGSATRVLPLTFEVSAACVRHLRVEPQLPAELVDMPFGRRLRDVYTDVNARFLRAMDAHLRAVVGGRS